jgi:hypothetical protein
MYWEANVKIFNSLNAQYLPALARNEENPQYVEINPEKPCLE